MKGPVAALLLLGAALLGACGDERVDSGAERDGRASNVSVGPQVLADEGAGGPLVAAQRDETVSEREAVLGGSLALIALLGATSFLLSGRVDRRVHVALSLLSVLVAVFGLYLLLGTASAFGTPLAAVAALLVLLAVLKLMSRFETTLQRRR